MGTQDTLNQGGNILRIPGMDNSGQMSQAMPPAQGALNAMGIRPSLSQSELSQESEKERLSKDPELDENTVVDENETPLEALKRLAKIRDARVNAVMKQYNSYEPSESEKWQAIAEGLLAPVRRNSGYSPIAAAMQNVNAAYAPVKTRHEELKRNYRQKAAELGASMAETAYKDQLGYVRDSEKARLAALAEQRKASLEGKGLHYETDKFGTTYVINPNKRNPETGEPEKTVIEAPSLISQEDQQSISKVLESMSNATPDEKIKKGQELKREAALKNLGNYSPILQAQIKKLNPTLASIESLVPGAESQAPSAEPLAPSAQGQVPGAPQLSTQGFAPSAAPNAELGGFRKAVGNVLPREGGFVGKDGQSGAPANFGINQAANPDVDVRNLTEDKAKEIYKTHYWDAIEADKLNPAAQEIAFDAAVNQGQNYAKELIRKTGGDPQKMIDQRRRDYIRLVEKDPQKINDFRGWMNRLDDVAAKAGVTSPTGQVPGTTGASLTPPSDTLEATWGQYINPIKLQQPGPNARPLDVEEYKSGMEARKTSYKDDKEKFNRETDAANSTIATTDTVLKELGKGGIKAGPLKSFQNDLYNAMTLVAPSITNPRWESFKDKRAVIESVLRKDAMINTKLEAGSASNKDLDAAIATVGGIDTPEQALRAITIIRRGEAEKSKIGGQFIRDYERQPGTTPNTSIEAWRNLSSQLPSVVRMGKEVHPIGAVIDALVKQKNLTHAEAIQYVIDNKGY